MNALQQCVRGVLVIVCASAVQTLMVLALAQVLSGSAY